jgi:hypothetical protein
MLITFYLSTFTPTVGGISNKHINSPDILAATKFGTLFDCHVGVLLGAKWGDNPPAAQQIYTPHTELPLT